MNDEQKEILAKNIAGVSATIEKLQYELGLHKGYQQALIDVHSGKIFDEPKPQEMKLKNYTDQEPTTNEA